MVALIARAGVEKLPVEKHACGSATIEDIPIVFNRPTNTFRKSMAHCHVDRPGKTGSAEIMETLHTFIEFGATGIDAMAVALILGTFVWRPFAFSCNPANTH